MKKKCSKCSESFPANKEYFYDQKSNKDGLQSWCKNCDSLLSKERYKKNKKYRNKQSKEYRRKNPEKIAELNKAWRAKNQEKARSYGKQYREQNKESLSKYFKDRYQRDKTKINDSRKEYYHRIQKHNIDFRLRKNLRRRLNHAIRGESDLIPLELVGCSLKELKDHLQAKFDNKMTWDNYGEWHIDHILPCASFDLTQDAEIQKCFHYTNLQPLWAADNMKKGCKIET